MEPIDIPLLKSVLEQVMPAMENDSNPQRAKQLAKAVAAQIESIRVFGLAELADAIDEPQTIRRFIEAAEEALRVAQADHS